MSKPIKIILYILLSLVLVVLLVLAGVKIIDGFKYSSFYKIADREFRTPGVADNFVPQGFEYNSEKDVFLSCGYMSDGSPSRVYVIDRKGKSYYTELVREDGSNYTGHAGGVTYYDNFLYVADFGGVDVFSLEDVLNKDTATAKAIGTIQTFDMVPAFVYSYSINGTRRQLLVGSFYEPVAYPTPEQYQITTPAGDKNFGTMFAFNYSPNAPLGISSPLPMAMYTLPSRVQGITIVGGAQIVLSTSYGLSPSQLYVHDLSKVLQNPEYDKAVKILGVNIPLYHIDSSNLLETITAPPMSEELVYLDGKVWVMNESACNKYIFGKFTTGRYVYSFEYPTKKK